MRGAKKEEKRKASKVGARAKPKAQESERGHRSRFDQLLDDAIIGVKKK